MSEPVVVVGAGGFGREVLDVIDACNAVSTDRYDLVGVLDDAPSTENLALLAGRGAKFLGCLDSWLTVPDPRVGYLIGIGSPGVRREIDRRLRSAGLRPVTLVHPTVVTGHDVELAPGVVVCAGVVMTNNIRVGRHTHLNLCTTVGHDASIGDYVTVNPSVNVSGCCVIEDDVLLGVGSIVLQGLTVHRGATVGAAACAVRDVPAETVVKGVPAR